MAGQSRETASSRSIPALVPLGHHTGKPPIPLHRPVTVIGSRSNARIHLTSSSVSKAHALIVRDGPVTYIRDLASRTKLYINGEGVHEHDLADQDLIKIGSFTFKFKSRQSSATHVPARSAKLEVSGADLPVPIDQRVLLIGRRSACDVHLLEESVSTAHAVILEMGGHHHVRDLGSRTGTYVNGVSCHQHQLNEGDRIRIGETTLTYSSTADISRLREAGRDAGRDTAFDLDIIDDSAAVEAEKAAREAEEIEGFNLPPVPEIPPPPPARARKQPEAVEQFQTSPPPASAEKPRAIAPLSEAQEKLSASEASSDSENRFDAVADAAAEPNTSAASAQGADQETSAPAEEDEGVLPRRGWRPIHPEATEPVEAAAAEPDQDDSVLRFDPKQSDSASLDDSVADDFDSNTATLDDQREDTSAVTAGEFTAGAFTNRSSRDRAERDELSDEELDELERDDAPRRLDIDLSGMKTPPVARSSKPAAATGEPSMDSIDFSTLRGDSAADLREDGALEAPIEAEAPAAEAPEVPPADAVDIAPLEVPTKEQGKRGRKPKEPAAKETKKPARGKGRAVTTRARKGPPVAQEAASEEAAPQEVEAADADAEMRSQVQADPRPAETWKEEIIDLNDPTLESAFESVESTEPSADASADISTDDASIDDASTDDASTDDAWTGDAVELSDDAAADSLSDTGLTREVRDLTGDAGEIVEAPRDERSNRVDYVSTDYRWGANQDNYLGGVPVTLHTGQQEPPAESRDSEPLEEVPEEAIDLDSIAEESSSEPVEAKIGDDEIEDEDLLAHALPEEADELGTIDLDDTNARDDEDLLSPPHEAPVHEDPAPVAPTGRAAAPTMPPRPAFVPIPASPLRGRRKRAKSEDFDRAMAFGGADMAPVRETDVFSQMSPPATTVGDPFADVAPSPGALTPMDLVEPEDIPQARRAPLTGRAEVREALFGGGNSPIREARRKRMSVRPAIPGVSAPTQAPEELESPQEEISSALPQEPDTRTAPARRPSVVMGEEALDVIEARRKRRSRLISLLLAAWIVVWGGTLAAVHYGFPVTSVSEVTVRFRNFDRLNPTERAELRKEQAGLLATDLTRQSAARMLHQIDPSIAAGFLSSPQEYLRAAVDRSKWAEKDKGDLVIKYAGPSEAGNQARVLAMAKALIERNESRTSDAKQARDRYEQLNASIARITQEQSQRQTEIERLRRQADATLDGPKLKAMESQVSALEKAWSDSLGAMKTAESELARLKQTPESANAPTTAPSGDAHADVELDAMQKQLADLSSKMSAAQAAKAEVAAQARKALDASLEQFEKQIAQTREAMSDSPELAAYISAATKLQETTRQLIDDLIRRQEQQYSRLSELKATLTEKMERRRADVLQGDAQLKEWNERLQTARRQLNAAKSAGMQEDALNKQSEVTLLENMIKGREDVLPKDATQDYADTIAQLQQIIDVTQKNVEDDRKRTDQLLAQLQKSFTSNQSIEKLPEAQKSVAADLEKRLADINTARQQYSQAISDTANTEDEAAAQMRTQIASLQAGIDARQKELATASEKAAHESESKSREELLAQKQTELDALVRAESDARLAFTNKEKELRDAQAAAQLARENQDHLQELQTASATADQQLQQNRRDQELAKESASRAVEPMVAEGTLRDVQDTDRRPTYWLISSVAIVVLFGSGLLMTLHRTGGDQGIDMETLRNHRAARNRSAAHDSGNGINDANGETAHDEDDQHPAAV